MARAAQRLRCGISKLCAFQRHVNRQEEADVAAYVHRGEGDAKRFDRRAVHVLQLRQALVVIDEHEAARSVCAQAGAQVRQVCAGDELLRRYVLHRREQAAEVLCEQMQHVQQTVLSARLAVLAQAGLEIVVENRHVVGVSGVGGFLKGGAFSDFVRAAVIHVIADEVVSAAELHQRQRIGVHGGDKGTAVMGDLQAAAQFAGGEGIALVGQSPAALVPVAHQIHAHGGVVARGVEAEMMRGWKAIQRCTPRRIDISGEHRQHLVHGNLRAVSAVPPGGGVQRRVIADLQR